MERAQSDRRGAGSASPRLFVMAAGYALLSALLELWLATYLADALSAFAWITAGYWILPRRDADLVGWVRWGVAAAMMMLLIGVGA